MAITAELPLNQVILGDCTEVMKAWPDDSIDLVVTSPPYWGLRDYGSETVRVWSGDPECEHKWLDETKKVERGKVRWQHELGGGIQNRFQHEEDPRKAVEEAREYAEVKIGYCSKCGAWRGSLGLEPHPRMFIDHFVEICREIKRVLKPSGTFWLNLGDTYYGSGGKGGQYEKFMPDKGQPAHYRQSSKTRSNWLQPKQLLGMPWRIAIALQHDGWILRNDIIWHKPNHMPSSVKDRLTNTYEHVFLLAKNRRYYFDLGAIRKPFSAGTFLRIEQPNIDNQLGGPKTLALRGDKQKSRNANRPIDIARELSHKIAIGESRGKNPGDVWRIPTSPFPGAHFATFPPRLIEPIIKAGSPQWICTKCGKPRERIIEPTPRYAEKLGKSVHNHKDDLKRGMRYDKVYNAEYVTAGWTDCYCGAEWEPGIVLDPFAGSGTVGQVARRLSRCFILIEIIPEYCKIAEQRIRGKYKPAPEGVTPLTKIWESP